MAYTEEQILKAKHGLELLTIIRTGIIASSCETVKDVNDLLEGMYDAAKEILGSAN